MEGIIRQGFGTPPWRTLNLYSAVMRFSQALVRYSDFLLAGALALLALYVSCNLYPRVRFDRERIDVSAAPGQLQVTGLYRYRNPSVLPAFLSLGLPFPTDGGHPFPQTYSVVECDENGRERNALHTREKNGEVRFRVFLMPLESKWIRVDYIQPASTNDGRYILLTTRKWGQPLDSGNYFLHLAPGLQFHSSNYNLQQVDASIYSFERRDFYPSEDWTFSWNLKTRRLDHEFPTQSGTSALVGDVRSSTSLGK